LSSCYLQVGRVLLGEVTCCGHGAGEAAVLYCWEVQVDQTVAKRRGLGRFFMTMLELLARKCVLLNSLARGLSSPRSID